MALGNFIVSGSYSNIASLQYNKSGIAVVSVDVYQNSSKDVKITSVQINIDMTNKVKKLDEGVPLVSDIPSLPLDKAYIVSGSPNNDQFNHLAGKLIAFGPAKAENLPNDEIVFKESDGKYYTFNGTVFVESVGFKDKRYFDQNLSVSAFDAANNNVIKALYLYLKSRPEFSGCTDV